MHAIFALSVAAGDMVANIHAGPGVNQQALAHFAPKAVTARRKTEHRSGSNLAPCLRYGHPDCPEEFRHGCFAPVFLRLFNESCMHRQRLPGVLHSNLAWTPFYVTHAPWLLERRRHVMAELGRVGAQDVTFVNCANGGDIGALSLSERACLHPRVADTRWTQPERQVGAIRNGTVSLIVKHMMAMHDMLLRRLHAAIVVEDDVVFSPTFRSTLLGVLENVPTDAALFYLGSYSRTNGNFRNFPYWRPSNRSAPSKVVHIRKDHNYILGTVAYVVYELGARQLVRPVVAQADIQFSLQVDPIRAPQPSYGVRCRPRRVRSHRESLLRPPWLIEASPAEPHGHLVDVCPFREPRPAAPSSQADSYLAWPSKNLGGGTHMTGR